MSAELVQQARPDIAAGGAGLHGAAHLLHVHAAAAGARVHVGADVADVDAAARGAHVQQAGDALHVNSAAGRARAQLAVDVGEVHPPTGRGGVHVARNVFDVDAPAGGAHIHAPPDAVHADAATRRLGPHGEPGRNARFIAALHAAAPAPAAVSVLAVHAHGAVGLLEGGGVALQVVLGLGARVVLHFHRLHNFHLIAVPGRDGDAAHHAVDYEVAAGRYVKGSRGDGAEAVAGLREVLRLHLQGPGEREEQHQYASRKN